MTSAEQYHRTELMLGSEGLARLRASSVFVAGLGAVGSYAIEALARAGVGRFQLVDFDVIQPSNINRQLFATHQTVDRLKTEAARERILSIAPDARVETASVLINDASVDALFTTTFSERPDFVIDAIDSLGPKVALIATALEKDLPLISSMGAALRFDASLVRVGRLTDVSYDPLAAQVRKRLRRREIDTDRVLCVYSTEQTRAEMRKGVETFVRAQAPQTPANNEIPPGRPRNTLGSLPTLVGLFGLRIAHEVILSLTRTDRELKR